MWSIYVLLALPELLNALLRHGYAWNDKAMQSYLLSSQAISVGCQIVVVVFLVRKAGWLASIVFPVEQEVSLSLSARDLQAALFSVVGLYFVLDGARHALGSAYQLVTRPRSSQNAAGYLWERDPENLVKSLGGMTAGALLLIGRRRLRDFWKSYIGRAPETEQPPEPPHEV